jgi:hypothetical protein
MTYVTDSWLTRDLRDRSVTDPWLIRDWHACHMSDICLTHAWHMSDTCLIHAWHMSDTCLTESRRSLLLTLKMWDVDVTDFLKFKMYVSTSFSVDFSLGSEVAYIQFWFKKSVISINQSVQSCQSRYFCLFWLLVSEKILNGY